MSSDAAAAAEPAAAGPATGWIVVAVALVAYLLPLRALLHAPGSAMEEGFMLVFPDRVLHGAVPNKDFLYLYGPGSLWSLAAVYKVFGTHLVVERMAGLVQLVGMAIAAGLLVRWWGRAVAVAAVLLNVVFVMPALQLTAIPWTGGAALALFALVALVQARSEAGTPGGGERAGRWALTGGVLAGFAMLFRIDLGLALALGGPVAVWALPRPIIKRAALGAGIGLAPYLVHLALAGPGNVVRGMLIDPIVHLRAARHLPVPPDPGHLVGVARVIAAVDRSWPLPRLSPAQQLFVWFVLLALAAVALVAFAVWRVRRDPGGLRPRVLLAGALFGLGMFPQALQRADSAHLAWVSGTIVVLLPAALAELVGGIRPEWSVTRIGAGRGTRGDRRGVVALPDVHSAALRERGTGLGSSPEEHRDYERGPIVVRRRGCRIRRQRRRAPRGGGARREAGEPDHRRQYRHAPRAVQRHVPLLPPARLHTRHRVDGVRARADEPQGHDAHR